MNSSNQALREIPAVDRLVEDCQDQFTEFPRSLLVRAVRDAVDEVRRQVVRDPAASPPGTYFHNGGFRVDVERRLQELTSPRHRAVVNATGIVLHTGLGRAPLSSEALAAARRISRYGIVEVDPATGERGRREAFVAELLQELTGAEEATVVNNNAAAVVLMLKALAEQQEVVISRGELVEIGGGFRVPEVMTQSGALLVEVGTTNRTRIADFEAAVGERTAMYLRVHPSNFKVVGFTEAPTSAQVADSARARGILAGADLGSGYLFPIQGLPFEDEPTVHEAVQAGFDVITFSGDKLLGGPQCGILVGKKDAIRRCRRHPLFRALRPDKLTLAVLESTLLAWRAAEGAPESLPLYESLLAPLDVLRQRAERIREAVSSNLDWQVRDSTAQVGSGSVPGHEMTSVALAVDAPGSLGKRWADQLRRNEPPVFGRVHEGRLLLDLRTVAPQEDGVLIAALNSIS